MKTLLMVAVLAGTAPALAHDDEHHSPKGKAKAAAHEDAPRSFDKKPQIGAWARCPVSGDVFRVSAETQMSEHDGRWYAFCCEDCKPDFDRNPTRYGDKKKAADSHHAD